MRFDLPYADRTGALDSLGRPLFNPADPWTLPPEGRPSLARPDLHQAAIRIRPRPREIPTLTRVLLARSSRPLAIYSLGEVEVRGDAPGSRPRTLRGRLTVRRNGGEFEVAEGGKTALSATARRLRILSLNPYNLLELGGLVYRGHFEIIAQGGDLLA
ncbi:MAG TPA: hypothetical protein VK465_03685, partial [Fibrobacteria bacterium]|nr:hypothetical protein [Fibrobacteria bacterium]